jgi:hypothetical protein
LFLLQNQGLRGGDFASHELKIARFVSLIAANLPYLANYYAHSICRIMKKSLAFFREYGKFCLFVSDRMITVFRQRLVNAGNGAAHWSE